MLVRINYNQKVDYAQYEKFCSDFQEANRHKYDVNLIGATMIRNTKEDNEYFESESSYDLSIEIIDDDLPDFMIYDDVKNIKDDLIRWGYNDVEVDIIQE